MHNSFNLGRCVTITYVLSLKYFSIIFIIFSSDKLSNSNNLLKDKVIVISGTFTHHSRDEYKDLIEKYGGKNSTSISKKTSFVLAGENMGPSKYEKCQILGIQILNEDDFLKMAEIDKI